MRRCIFPIVVALTMIGPNALAFDLGNPDQLLSVEIHAFVSQGFLVSTANNYLAHSKDSSFEFTEGGINFTKSLTDKLRIGLQLFGRKLGPLGDYSLKLDWFYLDYRIKDWLGLRAGRVKLPFGLYNDSSDIDSARIPVLLPQGVYPTQNRDFLLAQTGAEVYGYLNLRAAGALEYRVYAGTIFLDITQTPGSPYQVVSLTTKYVVGGRLLWETPLPGLRVGGTAQALRLDTKLLSTTPPAVNVSIPAVLTVGSIEYVGHNLLFAAEYSRWFVDVETSDPMRFPASPTTVSERAYVMAGYRAKRWLQTSLYYSLYYPNVVNRNGRANSQHDIAATVRFDINSFWLVKLEGHYMNGTAALQTSLNDGQPLATLERNWGFFLVKTTAYF